MIWNYPISDGMHLGTFIAAVKEGFISLPYNIVDKDDNELIELDDAAMFDADSMRVFIDDWRMFSDDLQNVMIDMRRILSGDAGETVNKAATIQRIDDLGRIVIPREIRKSIFISEGDPLEITTENGAVILRKHKAE